MYPEDDLLPISALQHLAFCERQWGLIHLEQIWGENLLTAQGRILHEHAHEPETEAREDIRIARGLRLCSLRLGLSGMADVVEFHRVGASQGGTALEGVPDLWQPFIVEYKRGRPKIGYEDEVQLCAQAICLEEMLGVSIPSAAFFYGQPRRRHDVQLNSDLREKTEALALHLHELTTAANTPAPEFSQKCKSCSLVDYCLPAATSGQQSARKYLTEAIAESLETLA